MKFSFSFDGTLPSGVEVFTGQKYSSEAAALSKAILKQVKKEEHHDNIYVIDRGLQFTRAMKDFEENRLNSLFEANKTANLRK